MTNYRYFFSDKEVGESPHTISKSGLFRKAKIIANGIAEDEGQSIPEHALLIRIENKEYQWRVLWNSDKKIHDDDFNKIYPRENRIIRRFHEV